MTFDLDKEIEKFTTIEFCYFCKLYGKTDCEVCLNKMHDKFKQICKAYAKSVLPERKVLYKNNTDNMCYTMLYTAKIDSYNDCITEIERRIDDETNKGNA